MLQNLQRKHHLPSIRLPSIPLIFNLLLQFLKEPNTSQLFNPQACPNQSASISVPNLLTNHENDSMPKITQRIIPAPNLNHPLTKAKPIQFLPP
jgi:hypothetical protein